MTRDAADIGLTAIFNVFAFPATFFGKNKARLWFLGGFSLLSTLFGLLLVAGLLIIPNFDSGFGVFLLSRDDILLIALAMFASIILGLFAFMGMWKFLGYDDDEGCVSPIDLVYTVLTMVSTYGLLSCGIVYLHYFGLTYDAVSTDYGFVANIIAFMPLIIPIFATYYQRILVLSLLYYGNMKS